MREFEVGQIFEREDEVTEDKILSFAEASGDFNLVHLNPDYAAQTRFKKRIAHGLLSAGFISAALASLGDKETTIIYFSQFLKFHRPVKIGDLVITHLEVTAVQKPQVSLDTTCFKDGKPVVSGQAQILTDPYPFVEDHQ